MIIEHRINTITDLEKTDLNNAIEVDIRWSDKYNELILTHELHCVEPTTFLMNFLTHYKNKLLILNIKSSLCEEKCIELLEKIGIENYLFLDSQIPDIIKLKKAGINKFIIRCSLYEKVNEKLLKNCKYIWIDCFDTFILNIKTIKKLLNDEYEIMFVSPELHGMNTAEFEFEFFQDQLKLLNNEFPNKIHICTDLKEKWDFLC